MRFGTRPSRQHRTRCHDLPRPATGSSLLILTPPPSCCLLIINEDNVSEQGLSVLPHSCGWLSAQVQSCRRFWHRRSPQAPTGRSAAPHASSSEPGRKRGVVAGMRQEHVIGTAGKQGQTSTQRLRRGGGKDLLPHVRQTQTFEEARAPRSSRHVHGGGLKLPTFQRGLAPLRPDLLSVPSS